LDCFGAKPECSVLFDDTKSNGDAALDLGINWQVADA